MMKIDEDKKEFASKNCICQRCPTWKDCGSKARAFCFNGKSKCIKEQKGCLCGGCPVHEKFKFNHGYYCMRGSEASQAMDGKKGM